MTRVFLKAFFFIGLVCASSSSFAFEVVNKKESFENLRYLSARLGMGVQTFTDEGNVNGTPGPSFQFALVRALTRGLDLEFLYQFSTFRFESSDPIVSNQTIDSRTGMHQELLRAVLYLPYTVGQPFLTAGFGGYHFTGLDAKTGLDLGYALEVPVGAGFRAFIAKNNISVQVEYQYHFLLGENQSATTLGLLGQNEFRFNAYAIMGSFTFHFF